MGGTNPVAPRARALGAELRAKREAAGYGVRELAALLGMSHSAISRYETGTRVPRPEDVAAILTALGVDNAEREALINRARDPGRPQWLAIGMTEQQRQLATLLEYERFATRIVDVSPLLIPGLLQTSDYARSIMRDADVPTGEIETRVAARLGRRDVLTRQSGATLLALVGEAVLRGNIGGPEVMRGQLRHLMTMGDQPSVDLRVVPIGGGWHPGLEGPFVLVEGDEGPVVHIEGRRSGLFLHEQDDVDAYRTGVEKVLRVAMSAQDTAAFIAREASTIAEGIAR